MWTRVVLSYVAGALGVAPLIEFNIGAWIAALVTVGTIIFRTAQRFQRIEDKIDGLDCVKCKLTKRSSR